MENVIFDGKWSFNEEWKESALQEILYDDGTIIYLRTAHHDNFIYIFLDVISNFAEDKEYNKDGAIICFEISNDKSNLSDEDDYCFGVKFEERNGFVIQGNGDNESNTDFKQISNPEGFIALASISDKNDRYSTIPHPSYEFRIPTDLVGRSNIYGFYFGVYDAYINQIYNWPSTAKTENFSTIPNPNTWGKLVSPDNSLPEFSWPLILLIPAFIGVVILTRINLLKMTNPI